MPVRQTSEHTCPLCRCRFKRLYSPINGARADDKQEPVLCAGCHLAISQNRQSVRAFLSHLSHGHHGAGPRLYVPAGCDVVFSDDGTES